MANTLISHVDVNETDAVWAVRHLDGSGSVTRMTECYVLRHNEQGQKFLGRFSIQETPTFEVDWQNASNMPKVSESDLSKLKKARMALLTMTEKLWGK